MPNGQKELAGIGQSSERRRHEGGNCSELESAETPYGLGIVKKQRTGKKQTRCCHDRRRTFRVETQLLTTRIMQKKEVQVGRVNSTEIFQEKNGRNANDTNGERLGKDRLERQNGF